MISDSKLDRIYDMMKNCGGLGGKVMGAGGGGFFMFYCPNHCKAKVRQSLREEGLRELPYDFDFDGAKVLVNF